MNSPGSERRQLVTQRHAALWAQRVSAGGADQEAVQRWLVKRPENVAAFESMLKWRREVEALPIEAKKRLARYAQALECGTPITFQREFRTRSIAVVALAAFVLLAVGTLWFFSAWSLGEAYATTSAENLSQVLEDGSKIELGAVTKVAVKYRKSMRDLQMVSGEAYFSVAKDAARPFVVQAGEIHVRALGTQFNVLRESDYVEVAVSEGTVEITTAPDGREEGTFWNGTERDRLRLSAGSRAVLRPKERTREIKSIEPAEVGSWREHRMLFDDEQIAIVLQRLERYARHTIRVDEKAGQQKFSGIVDLHRIDAWALNTLPVNRPVRSMRQADGTILVTSK